MDASVLTIGSTGTAIFPKPGSNVYPLTYVPSANQGMFTVKKKQDGWATNGYLEIEDFVKLLEGTALALKNIKSVSKKTINGKLNYWVEFILGKKGVLKTKLSFWHTTKKVEIGWVHLARTIPSKNYKCLRKKFNTLPKIENWPQITERPI